MKFLSSISAAGLAIVSMASAAALPDTTYGKRCTNGPSSRSCWGNYDISTDYYTKWPSTGVTRTYDFTLKNVTMSPDGVPRTMLTVNGMFPGPTIEANWGDTIVVHLTNGLANNGTSIHFHGVRQLNTNQEDGTVAITQCPTAPGDTITYKWQATQYGSSWYHSHFGLQTWDGVFGGIVIHGPASANYDKDLGNLFISDWTHETPDALLPSVERTGPPVLDNGLINGTNVYNGAGKRYEATWIAGTKYLLRIANTAIDSHFKFMIDNHSMTVIANDFVPIKPFTTNVLSVGIGQRYDVVIDTKGKSGNYWMRAIPQSSCSDNANADNIRGIIRYASSTADPTTTAYTYTDDCTDEPAASLVPYVAKNVGSATLTSTEDVTLAQVDTMFKWFLNNVTLDMQWNNPTLLQVENGVTVFSVNESVIPLPTANEWAYVVIESALTLSHPIHLHGHDFFVLASGTGTYSASTPLQKTNPPRRDVAMLPGSGFLVLAFPADNPGAWLMHCHIGWHQEGGFALQFVEQQSKIKSITDKNVLTNTCNKWNTWAAAHGLAVKPEDYSGI